MNKVICQITAAGVLAMALAACSAKVDGGGPLPVPLSPLTPQTSSQPTVLEGTWASGCAGANGFYLKVTAAFASNTYNTTTNVYSDAACSQAIQGPQNQSGTFSIGGAATVSGAQNIDETSSAGVSTFDIFEIDSKGALYFGANPGNTAATRSTQLNSNLPLTKVN